MKYDLFISYASEDKEKVALPLAKELGAARLSVWIDESELHIGDSIRESIDQGLAEARFGVVILSPNYFARRWTRLELDAILAKDDGGGKFLLPVWHRINREGVAARSPILATRLAVSTEVGIKQVAQAIIEAIRCHDSAQGDEPLVMSLHRSVDSEVDQIRKGMPGAPSIPDLQATLSNLKRPASLFPNHPGAQSLKRDVEGRIRKKKLGHYMLWLVLICPSCVVLFIALRCLFPPRTTPEKHPCDFKVLTVDERGAETERHEGEAQCFVEDLGGGVTLTMVEVPAGAFLMGSSNADAQQALDDATRYDDEIGAESFDSEKPQHMVKVPSFFMGRFEVTQAQWRAVANMPQVTRTLKPDQSRFRGNDQNPVDKVSWEDAVEFCERLSRKTGRTYRLPTEAEWEYACRAGTTTPFAFGETVTPELVRYQSDNPYRLGPSGTYQDSTMPVGSLGVANWFGLYDMHGNVMEWCFDVWHDNYMGAPQNGSAWMSGDTNYRVLRGGGYSNDGFVCRSAFRNKVHIYQDKYNMGLRVVAEAK